MTHGDSGLDAPQRRSQDRRRTRTLHYPERRTGFDRRSASPGTTGTASGVLGFVRERDLVLAGMLCVLNVLNMSDLLMTFQLMEHGAVEGNLLMGTLLGADPIAAAAFKVVMLGAVSLVIWNMRRYRTVLLLALISVGGFALLFAYELVLLMQTG
jgi:hypothetical protein